MSDSNGQSRRELRKFEAAEKIARGVSTVKVNSPHKRQRSMADVKVFRLAANPTKGQWKELFEARYLRYLRICSLEIPGIRRNGKHLRVPVTPPTDHVNPMFHIISMGQGADGTVDILIREYDCYVVAFRAYFGEEERFNAPWCCLENMNLLPSFLGPRMQSSYGPSYGVIADVKLMDRTVANLFEFLYSFRENPAQDYTGTGTAFIQTLFFLFGECQRFKIAQDLLFKSFDPNLLKPISPGDIGGLFQDWSSLCKCVFALWQYELEMGMNVPSNEAARTLRMSNLKWLKRERKHKGVSINFKVEGIYSLNSLVGRELLLLRHDEWYCTRVLMRSLGYTGRWSGRLVDKAEPEAPESSGTRST